MPYKAPDTPLRKISVEMSCPQDKCPLPLGEKSKKTEKKHLKANPDKKRPTGYFVSFLSRFYLSCFEAFLDKGSSKTSETLFAEKNMSKTFYKKTRNNTPHGFKHVVN